MYSLYKTIYSGGGRSGRVIRALNPVAWFRLGQGITVATGVSQWNDQSGNGNNLVQATGAAQPVLQADGSILFDGVAQYLAASFTLAAPQSVYLLGKQVTWTSQHVIFDGVNDISMMLQQTSGAGVSPNVEMRTVAGAGTNDVDWTLGSYAVVSAVFGASNLALQVNKGTATSDALAGGAAGGFTLGTRGAHSGLFGNVQVKEAIIFPAAHDATTRARVINYLSSVGQLGL